MSDAIDQAFASLEGSLKSGASSSGKPNMSATEGGGELSLWNPFGKNVDLHVHTPQWLDRTLAGAGQGMTDIARHVGNLLGGINGTTNADLKEAAETDAPLLATTGGKVGNFIGTTALTAPLMGGVGGAALKAGGTLGSIAANTLGRGALEGAAQGFLTADPGDRLSGTLSGAALGTALPGLGRLGGKFLKGAARSPEAQALLDRGIDLTPGQLNPLSQRNASEEALQSAPLVGAMIRRARMQPVEQWQQAAVREGAAPGAQIAGGDIHQMLSSAYGSFDPLYSQARGFTGIRPVIMRTGKDTPLNDAFRSAVADKSALASNQDRKLVQDFLSNEASRFNGSSDSLLDMRSNVRSKIRELNQSGGKEPQAQLLGNAEQSITQALESQLPKNAVNALRTADSKYGTYKTLQNAVAKSKDQSSGMTPTNLSNAVREATPEGVYARGGGGPLRDLAQQGKQVFDVRTPPTGARLGMLATDASATMHHPLIALPLALARLGTIATAPGRRAMAGTTGWQKGGQAALNNLRGQIPARALPYLDVLSRAGIGAGLLPQFPQAAATGAAGAAGLLGDMRSLIP